MKRGILFVTAALVVAFIGVHWVRSSAPRPVPDKDWEQRYDVTDPIGNLYLDTAWDPGTGVFLKFANAQQTKALVVQLHERDRGVWPTPAEAFPPFFAQSVQYQTEALGATATDHAEITVKFRAADWLIYLDNRLVVRMPAPWTPPATVLQERSEIPEAQRDEPFFQRVLAFTFQDDFLIPDDEENPLPAWTMQAGEWILHTAADTAVERRNIDAAATNRPEPARSPNFYSLLGKGNPARMVTGHYFYDNYSIEGAMEVRNGEMGLMFHVQDDGAFHAFTLRSAGGDEVVLQLWRQAGGDGDPAREVMQSVAVELTRGQWVMLRVVAGYDRVRCYLGDTLVIDAPADLPVGGPFGLFADSDEGVRFDDVAAATAPDLSLRAMADVKYHTRQVEGRFFPGNRRFFGLLDGNAESSRRLQVPAAGRAQQLVLGSAQHGPHLFGATFHPETPRFSVGLLAGVHNDDGGHYRFTCDQTESSRIFVLEEIRDGQATVLEEFALAGMTADAAAGHPVRLAMDASQGDGSTLRLFHDDTLVLIHHADAPVAGASGLAIGPRTGVEIDQLDYVFERTDLNRNQYEMNRIFVTDPFMRHWSSPEGAWITMPDGRTWYKGDFFGRFLVRLPAIAGSEVHIGVPEDGDIGEYVLKATDTEVLLYRGADIERDDADALRRVTIGELDTFEGDTTPPPDEAADDDDRESPPKWYSLHYEGHWLHLTSGDRVRWKLSVPAPLKGRRMRLAGLSTDDLTHSYVERYNVKDFLFTESLHDWTINGGSWAVINRFQCQPRWSHMCGESRYGLAALWADYRFTGDFCVEMYAGMRHGWYHRPGDLNLTIMNQDTTPSQGYTVTTTGWDINHSQLWTKLFRNGEVIRKTDTYTVPRVREGQQRRGYNPLVAGGRDIHGAWYYIKLRKVGNRLEYYFDNELAFSVDDPDPLEDGAFGIWTFMNSMMVARVNVAAQGIERRETTFRTLRSADDAEALLNPPQSAQEADRQILKDGVALGAMHPSLWTVDNPVGRDRLEWHVTPERGPYFSVTSRLGSGRMLAESHLPPVQVSRLAGWRFHLKATPRAKFNFHYRIGTLNDDGTVDPVASYFHQLSGTDFSRSSHILAGRTPVRPGPERGADWHLQGDWQPVQVWLPQEVLRNHSDRDDIYVQVVGFGNLQASDVLQGLPGNGPGEGYAVMDFSEIRYATPTLAASDRSDPSSLDLTVRGIAPNASGAATYSDPADVNQWLERRERSGLHRATLTVSAENGNRRTHDLVWIKLPDALALAYEWSSESTDAIVVRNEANYPDPRFAKATMSSMGQTLETLDEGIDARFLLLPRTPRFTAQSSAELTVDFRTAGNSRSFSLPWSANTAPRGPVLTDLQGPTPLLETFESASPLARIQNTGLIDARAHGAPQSRYARVDNRGRAARLTMPFTVDLNLATHPLYAMRYRGGDMSRVSLALKGNARASFSEENAQAVAVRHAPAAQLDGQWHCWLGFASDAIQREPFNPNVFRSGRVTLGSFGNPDQTGLYSTLDVDNVVFGPAVRNGQQLAFAPRFFARREIRHIEYALRPGVECYPELDDTQRRTLQWQRVEADQQIAPVIEHIPEGIAWLFVRAIDAKGISSDVYGIPFLADRTAPVAAYQFVDASEVTQNQSILQVTVASQGGAPLDVGRVSVKWNGEAVAVDAGYSSFEHRPTNDVLHLNWPHIFRDKLDATADGDRFTVTISGLVDGAGNAGADLDVPIAINHGADTTPPTLLALNWPDNVLFHPAWNVPGHDSIHLSTPQHHPIQVVQRPNREGFVRFRTRHANGQAWRDFKGQEAWDLNRFPYLAFNIRRPNVSPRDNTRIEVELTCSDDTTYRIPLTDDGDGDNVIALASALEWDREQWTPVLVDLAARITKLRQEQELEGLLEDSSAGRRDELIADLTEQMKRLKVTRLRFVVTGAQHNYPVDVKDLFVFGPWGDDRPVAVDAYDASGIDGVELTTPLGTVTEGRIFNPAAHAATGWITARILDKAGNRTHPVNLPVAPEDN